MSQKWPLLSGITRNVRKLASLSGSRNFRWGGGGGAIFGTLQRLQ